MDALRAELQELAAAITDEDGHLSEEEYDALVEQWAALCPHPGGTDILFWPNEVGLCRPEEVDSFQMTVEEIVDFALSWKPRTVAMLIVERTGGPSAGHYVYRLEAPNTPRTQVTTGLQAPYERGTIVSVALKGAVLGDGSRVEATYEHGVMSCGKILGLTDRPVGTTSS